MVKKVVMSNNQPTCVIYPLERRKIIKKTLYSSFWWLVIFVIFWIYMWLNTVFLIFGKISVLIYFIFLLLILIYEIYYYKFYYYDLRDDLIVIRKGVISRTEANTQYQRIQNVFVDQDMLDRIFKMYDVHIITAGLEIETSQPLNHIDGLSKENAEKIRDFILAKTKRSEKVKQGL